MVSGLFCVRIVWLSKNIEVHHLVGLFTQEPRQYSFISYCFFSFVMNDWQRKLILIYNLLPREFFPSCIFCKCNICVCVAAATTHLHFWLCLLFGTYEINLVFWATSILLLLWMKVSFVIIKKHIPTSLWTWLSPKLRVVCHLNDFPHEFVSNGDNFTLCHHKLKCIYHL